MQYVHSEKNKGQSTAVSRAPPLGRSLPLPPKEGCFGMIADPRMPLDSVTKGHLFVAIAADQSEHAGGTIVKRSSSSRRMSPYKMVSLMIWEKMIARRRIMGKSEFPEEQPLPVKPVRTESPPQALRIPLSGRTP